MRSGLRYLRHSPVLRASLMRAFLFTFFVSAVWALWPVVAKRICTRARWLWHPEWLAGTWRAGGRFAAGSVRKRVSADWMITASTGVFIATLGVMAFVHIPAVVIPSLMCAGFAWTTTMSTLNVSVQLSVPLGAGAGAGRLPDDLPARHGLRSVLWGYIASTCHTEVSGLRRRGVAAEPALRAQAACAARRAAGLQPVRLQAATAAVSWESDPDDGPVRVSVVYNIRVEDYDAFSKAVHKLGACVCVTARCAGRSSRCGGPDAAE